jgi:hexosaminidase
MMKWWMQNMIWSGKLIIVLILSILVYSCSDKGEIIVPSSANYDIIPKPQITDPFPSFFLLNNASIIADQGLEVEAQEFSDYLDHHFEINVAYSEDKSVKKAIVLLLLKEGDFGTEGYRLTIEENLVQIESNKRVGISRALSTLKQLAMLNNDSSNYFLPALKIEDWAGFEHRGLLLDCSRHFFSKEVVKKYIDLLAFYKMNVFHWHLTEDQAWRIAIDKYPKLTEIGAWRTESDGSIYGGFYTKDEIKEVVAYAAQKHITIIPEIELPGHSQAAIASYPYLSCTGDSIAVANDWGVFKDIYCAGNDSVFDFLEDVLTEVMELFPSEYIHIGGDEAPKIRWEQCDKCQKRMSDHQLKDEHELQSYFIKRIQTFLNSNGRQMIGWDEILEGGLADEAIVQSWRGMEGGVAAVHHGNKAIMSPTSHAYFDYGLKAIDLQKVYSFYPIPKGIYAEESELIIGGECNMWTEHVPDEANLDSKVFPRLLAMSEVLWSDSTGRDYDEFLPRVYAHQAILKKLNVKYGLETTPFVYEVSTDSSEVKVSLNKRISNVNITYQINNDKSKMTYQYPLLFDLYEPTLIIASAERNNEQIGIPIPLKVYPHMALNKNILYISEQYSGWYTAGGSGGLVDGVLGSLDFRDGRWQGFWGTDLECIIDFGNNETEISYLEVNFYQYNNAWIFIPKEMWVEVSIDGKIWEKWGIAKSTVDPKQRGKFIHPLYIEGEIAGFQYLKFKVINLGKVPDWHEAAGSDAWIFIDEIILK